MRLPTTVLLLIAAAIVPGQTARCQSLSADSAFLAQAVSLAVASYEQAQRLQSALYNGSEYVPIPEPYDGFPFFGSEYLEEGSIKYSGELFDNVPMQYDLVQDQLVIEHFDQRGYVTDVRLHDDLVEYFDLLGHHFVSVTEDSIWGGLRRGYYELLHDGSIKLLCKHRKERHETIENGTVNVRFLERTNYYLVKDGKSFTIKNKASVLKALADKKKALKQFARANRVDQIDREKMMISLIRHYESLD